ncbi:efflux RND transporter periplasmic adaptor subunit [Tepidimonas charontis]|uniref:Cobalt-zinc-cadmium resistance protein CzcB n=1 Tax=Tepidimonas charontis TaxID=2267262 RepID=A0A554XJZ0_9BURK|nr:efflux RND transporter periplasmic adaptor subunit [Tepidimonas charontis]TSE36146.1 Cobalt-zinc-cadmium resistance protein CzcB [Tepidimonas charontis]
MKCIRFLRQPRLAVLACALGWLSASWASSTGSARSADNAAPTVAPALVSTAAWSSVRQYPLRSAPAQLLPRNEARISAEVSGRIERWFADVGQRVAAGAALAQLDATDLALARERARTAWEAAQARLALAESQLRRARELQAQGFLSPEALHQRETEVALQRAEVANTHAQWRSAEHQLSKTVIRAPFAGTVMQRLAQQGEVVATGTPLFVLAELRAPEVQAQLSPADARDLRNARDAELVTRDGQTVPLRWLRATGAVASGTRLQTVRLAVLGATELLPGSDGELRWRSAQPHVPPALLVRRGDTLGLFVVDDGAQPPRARWVPLPAAQEGRAAPVDLPADARIIVRGQQAVQAGQPVRVLDAAAPHQP